MCKPLWTTTGALAIDNFLYDSLERHHETTLELSKFVTLFGSSVLATGL